MKKFLVAMLASVVLMGGVAEAASKVTSRSFSSSSRSYSAPKYSRPTVSSTPSRPATVVSRPVSRPAVVSSPTKRATVSAPVRQVKSPTVINKTTVVQKNYYGGSRGYSNGNNYYNRGYSSGGYGGGMGGGSGLGTALVGGAVGGLAGAAVYDALTDNEPKAPTTTTTSQPVVEAPAPIEQAVAVPEEEAQEKAPEVVPPPYALPQDSPLMMAPQFYNGVKQ